MSYDSWKLRSDRDEYPEYEEPEEEEPVTDFNPRTRSRERSQPLLKEVIDLLADKAKTHLAAGVDVADMTLDTLDALAGAAGIVIANAGDEPATRFALSFWARAIGMHFEAQEIADVEVHYVRREETRQ